MEKEECGLLKTDQASVCLDGSVKDLAEDLSGNPDEKTIDALTDSFDEVIEKAIEKAVEKAFKKAEEVQEKSRAIELQGAITGETGRETPDKRVDFSKLSYSELCSFLERHPQAKI